MGTTYFTSLKAFTLWFFLKLANVFMRISINYFHFQQVFIFSLSRVSYNTHSPAFIKQRTSFSNPSPASCWLFLSFIPTPCTRAPSCLQTHHCPLAWAPSLPPLPFSRSLITALLLISMSIRNPSSWFLQHLALLSAPSLKWFSLCFQDTLLS